MGFSGETVLKRLNKDSWVLESTLIYENDKIKVTLTPGLVTDGASIPKAAWSIIGSPLMGKYVGAALIHDGLYMSELVEKHEADNLFHNIMLESGVNKVKAYAMFEAVNLFGQSVWDAHTKESITEGRKFVVVEDKK